MADLGAMERDVVLDDIYGGSKVARLSAAKPASRISLRAGPDAVDALSQALGLALPVSPGRSSVAGARTAFWLGPDEWLVIDTDEADLASLCSRVVEAHAAVDVSHRNAAILLEGPGAASALSFACPMDLRDRVFPVGKVTRTVLGKAEIVLYRVGTERYHIECWRSFASYVFALLDEGARDAARV
ncbi:sarcosine oxidase subunit gamma family protein [Martelella alba]|uniref:Sarcosine oxidase subunit gamma family protein n=1 Tax=Martelella alba TaxID=2590451 RepID=A0A506UAK1_9HYPH|nr:sarcosine oxidase subunit gamma family protein [Martelella alba]TPW30548.1 sarcosine oxidase subunit gamma family protein [Martelella alba]